MSDLISREQAIEEIKSVFEWHDVVTVDRLVEHIKALPSAQKTGHWIDKSRGDQKNSECSECHTLFRVLIHDYPYCPCCGSKNRGE